MLSRNMRRFVTIIEIPAVSVGLCFLERNVVFGVSVADCSGRTDLLRSDLLNGITYRFRIETVLT